MKKVRFVLAIILVSSANYLIGQDFLSWQFNDRYFSAQIGTGSSTYFGDLKHDNHIRRTFSNVNVGLEARLLSKVSARFQATHYGIKGADHKAKDSTYAQQRNLSFNSKNWEFNLSGIYYLNAYKGDYFRRLRWDPYVFAGLGATYFNPKTDVSGETVSLADLKTEGKDYSQWALVVPVGLGVKFKINTFMNFNLEASYRYSFTDYLDDVSTKYARSYPNLTTELIANRKDEIPVVNQNAYDNILIAGGRRGNSSTKDSYLFLNVQLEFYLPPDLFSKEKPLFKKTSTN